MKNTHPHELCDRVKGSSGDESTCSPQARSNVSEQLPKHLRKLRDIKRMRCILVRRTHGPAWLLIMFHLIPALCRLTAPGFLPVLDRDMSGHAVREALKSLLLRQRLPGKRAKGLYGSVTPQEAYGQRQTGASRRALPRWRSLSLTVQGRIAWEICDETSQDQHLSNTFFEVLCVHEVGFWKLWEGTKIFQRVKRLLQCCIRQIWEYFFNCWYHKTEVIWKWDDDWIHHWTMRDNKHILSRHCTWNLKSQKYASNAGNHIL